MRSWASTIFCYSNGGYAGNVATGAGSAASVIGRSQTQGAIEQTGRSLDVAIQGNGYIEVRQADGTIGLTRNGALEMNAQGQLTSQEATSCSRRSRFPRVSILRT